MVWSLGIVAGCVFLIFLVQLSGTSGSWSNSDEEHHRVSLNTEEFVRDYSTVSLEHEEYRGHRHKSTRGRFKNKKKKKPKKKYHLMRHPKSRGDALNPMTSRAATTRGNYEDLSKMSSLDPEFWVRPKLPSLPADPLWNKHADCRFGSRKATRPYPDEPVQACYTREFTEHKTKWWNFWAEIRGDLQYAFDFVLWDEYEPYHETNSLWYLMLYLKTLVARDNNPENIVSLGPGYITREYDRDKTRKNSEDIFFEDDKDISPVRGLLSEYNLKIEQLESLLAD